MSPIHYKFRSSLQYKTLMFEGLQISVVDLKWMICKKEGINVDSFDLLLVNGSTRKRYEAGDLIPRNSGVIVLRTPRSNGVKLPKVKDMGNSGMVGSSGRLGQNASQPLHIQSEAFSQMTEDQRLAHVKEVSCYKYQPVNYQRRATTSGRPPTSYVCNRCNEPGHWYKECPQLLVRRSTGIPSHQLMNTSPDDPNAMLHPSGRFVVPILHHRARLEGKKNAETSPLSHSTTSGIKKR